MCKRGRAVDKRPRTHRVASKHEQRGRPRSERRLIVHPRGDVDDRAPWRPCGGCLVGHDLLRHLEVRILARRWTIACALTLAVFGATRRANMHSHLFSFIIAAVVVGSLVAFVFYGSGDNAASR